MDAMCRRDNPTQRSSGFYGRRLFLLSLAACMIAGSEFSHGQEAKPARKVAAVKKAKPAVEPYYSAYEEDGKWGYKDGEKIALAPRFEEARHFTEGLAPVKVGKKWGFIDRAFKIAIEPAFDDCFWFTDGVAPVQVGSVWGLIDKTGKMFVAPQFEAMDGFNGGLAYVQYKVWEPGIPKEQQLYPHIATGFIDKTGTVVIGHDKNNPLMYSGDFSGGLAEVIDTKPTPSKCGYVDKTGRIAIPIQFESCGGFREGAASAPVTKDGKKGVVDRSGQFSLKVE